MSTFQIIALAGAAIICFTYAIIIGLFTISWFRLPRYNASAQASKIFVTLIIAARNEAANIGACLEAIAAQDYSKEHYEVIVVDDHSSDDTAEVVRNIISADPMRKIRLLSSAAGSQGKKEIGRASCRERVLWYV